MADFDGFVIARLPDGDTQGIVTNNTDAFWLPLFAAPDAPVILNGVPYQTAVARPVVTVTDYAALRAANVDQAKAGQLSVITAGASVLKLYVWSPSSVAADDGATVIKPDVPAGPVPGRWLIYGDSLTRPNTYVLRDTAGHAFVAGINERIDINDAAAFNIRANVGVTYVTIDHAPKLGGGGAGSPWTIAAQQGAPGQRGGDLTLAAGSGGTPGTDPFGYIKLEIGVPDATDLTGEVRVTSGGAQYLRIGIDNNGGQDLLYESGAAIGGFEVGNTHRMQVRAGTVLELVSEASEIRFTDDVVGGAAYRMLPNFGGPVEFVGAASTSAVLFSHTQRVAGPGGTTSIQAQQGAVGSAGGDLSLSVGPAGTPGTGSPGNLNVEVGRANSSGLTGAVRYLANGVELARRAVDTDVVVDTIAAAATGHRTVVANGAWQQIVAAGRAITFSDDVANPTAFTIVPDQGATISLEAHGSSTALQLGVVTLAGNGTKAGGTTTIYGGRGQNVAAGTNNDGGLLTLRSGSPGTGGSGGVPGNVVLGIGSSEATLTLEYVSATARRLRWLSGVTVPTIDQADTTTASATGATLTLRAQAATGTTATGGLASVEGGAGTAQGGGVSLVGGNGTAANAPGGSIEMKGGSRTGTGAQGSIALHATGVTYGGGARITFFGNADAEPTSAPSNGQFWWQVTGQARSWEPNGHRDEINYFDGAAGGTSKRRIRRMGRVTPTGTGVVYPVTVVAAQLPSTDYVATVRAYVVCYDTNDNSVFEGERRACLKRTSGTVTVQQTAANQIIGVDEAGAAGSNTVYLETDGSGGVRVRYSSSKGSNLQRVTAWLDVFVSAH